jgi:peptide deformylase
MQIDATGLFARCVQHELDHLDGVLFTDRMSPSARADLQEELDIFETEFGSRRGTGAIPSDEQIAKQWADWEARYA